MLISTLPFLFLTSSIIQVIYIQTWVINVNQFGKNIRKLEWEKRIRLQYYCVIQRLSRFLLNFKIFFEFQDFSWKLLHSLNWLTTAALIGDWETGLCTVTVLRTQKFCQSSEILCHAEECRKYSDEKQNGFVGQHILSCKHASWHAWGEGLNGSHKIKNIGSSRKKKWWIRDFVRLLACSSDQESEGNVSIARWSERCTTPLEIRSKLSRKGGGNFNPNNFLSHKRNNTPD